MKIKQPPSQQQREWPHTAPLSEYDCDTPKVECICVPYKKAQCFWPRKARAPGIDDVRLHKLALGVRPNNSRRVGGL